MIHTGLMMAAFIAFHLAHYTFRWTDPSFASLPEGDIYAMVIAGFSSPAVSGFYVLAMLALSFHLCHGVSSVFQTLGLYHGNLNPMTEKLGPIVATIVFVGFSSIPLAVLAGLVK
jgi:succinate dehydrogenase / fumarate reductase cytochrome b subunit